MRLYTLSNYIAVMDNATELLRETRDVRPGSETGARSNSGDILTCRNVGDRRGPS